MKTIKISKKTYARLCEIAGERQVRLRRPVSLDEAVRYLINVRGKGVKITDLAGSWDVSEEEVAKIRASFTEAWKKWRLPETLYTSKRFRV